MTETLIRTRIITPAENLRPGDVITQGYLDGGDWTSRDIRLDRIHSAYLVYNYGGRDYLVPVVTLHGWDVRRGRSVEIVSATRTPWEASRES